MIDRGRSRRKLGRLRATLFVLVALGACTTEQRIDRKFREASRALRAGNAAEAADHYYMAFELEPDGPRAAQALFEYARAIEVHQNEPGLATEIYRRVARLFSTRPEGKQALERAAWIELKRLRHPQAALLDYNRLLEIYTDAPERPVWMLQMAGCYLELGNAIQAETELRSLLENRPKLEPQTVFEAQDLLGRVLLMQDRAGEAAKEFEELSRRLAENPEKREMWLETRFNLAQALAELDETERALEVLRGIEADFPRQEVIQEKINFLSIRQQERNR